MKLPDFMQFEPLNRMRSLMNAELVDSFSFGGSSKLSFADLEEMVNGGKEVIGIDEIRVLEDGTLAYKDSRVLLHIRDIRSHYRAKSENNLPRFHVADCKTLQMMKRDNRYGRYVLSIRMDGIFDVIFVDRSHNVEKRELEICWNCLAYLSYKGFNKYYGEEKINIRKNFSIKEYFTIYPRSIISVKPKYNSSNSPVQDYPKNWKEISERYRSAVGYICENNKCGVVLNNINYRRYLQVHHKNGQTNDCSDSNLQSLCIYCHAQEPMHSQLKGKDYNDFLVIRQNLLTSLNNK